MTAAAARGDTARVGARTTVGRIGLAALWPCVACFGGADYHCRSDADCRWGDRRGVCEATDYCSYADPECPSHARYSDQAGELANVCVSVADSSGSSAGGSSSTGTSSTAGSSSESAPPIPVCGDEIVEGDEICDDGNAVDGDGCNVDCRPSGTPRWDPPERVHGGATDADALFVAVDVRSDGSIIAVGTEVVADDDALMVLWQGDGELAWARQFDRGMGDDDCSSVSAGVGSEIYVAGRTTEMALLQGWIGVVEPADGDVESFAFTGQRDAVAVAYMYPSRLVVAGYGAGVVGARGFGEMLTPQWEAEQMDASASMANVAVDGGLDLIHVAGPSQDHARVLTVLPGADPPLLEHYVGPATSGVQGLARAGTDLVIAGYVGLEMRDVWIARLDPEGVARWTWTIDQVGEDEVEDVAIAPDGDIVAVGFTTGAAQDARVWKLDPAGVVRWSWTWDEPWPNDDVARGVAVFDDGDIAVVGGRTGDDGATDAWVVRLTP